MPPSDTVIADAITVGRFVEGMSLEDCQATLRRLRNHLGMPDARLDPAGPSRKDRRGEVVDDLIFVSRGHSTFRVVLVNNVVSLIIGEQSVGAPQHVLSSDLFVVGMSRDDMEAAIGKARSRGEHPTLNLFTSYAGSEEWIYLANGVDRFRISMRNGRVVAVRQSPTLASEQPAAYVDPVASPADLRPGRGFQSTRWGMKLGDIRALYPTLYEDAGVAQWVTRIAISQRQFETRFTFDEKSGGLIRTSLALADSDTPNLTSEMALFTLMRKGLISKFGPPTVSRTLLLERLSMWLGKLVVVRLHYDASPSDGQARLSVLYQTRPSYDAEQRENEAAAKRVQDAL